MELSFDKIISKAISHGKKHLVVARGQDIHTLESVNDAIESGLIEATIVGETKVIEQVCKKEGIDMSRFTIIEESDPRECVNIAVKMVNRGEADVLMKGLVPTDVYMRGILNKEFGLLPPRSVLSHITVLKVPNYHKYILISDVAIIPNPDLGQKRALIGYLVDTAHKLGIEEPKVACLAPSEQVLVGIESSTEAAILAKMGDRGAFGKAQVDGPLALDVALFKEVVETKGLQGSKVAGDADCLLFPNLDAANVFFKYSSQICELDLACMLVGATAPCVLTSRGDSRQTKLNSIALSCLSAN